jgi:hypothetical protein
VRRFEESGKRVGSLALSVRLLHVLSTVFLLTS